MSHALHDQLGQLQPLLAEDDRRLLAMRLLEEQGHVGDTFVFSVPQIAELLAAASAFGFARGVNAQLDAHDCRICGCTEEHACEGGCWWAEPDLCSTCADAGLS